MSQPIFGATTARAADPAGQPSGLPVDAVEPPKPIATQIDAPPPSLVADVVLELVIDVGGHVTAVTPLDGPEPLRARAAAAAQGFVFEPARRGGHPVAARIRFVAHFEPQLPAPEVSPARSSSPVPPMLAPPARAAPIQITVLGTLPAREVTMITRNESRELPGTFGDPLRAVEASPGVTPIFSGVPLFFVRGAPPGNVAFFLDGVRVPLLYHALLGPSVIHPGLIGRLDFYPGVAPARYGGAAGAVVSATTREPLGRLAMEGNVRAFDAGGLLETPILGGRGSLLVGGRYSYTALIASRLLDADLAYWDYQARATIALDSRSEVRVFAFGAYDRFEGADLVAHGGGTQFHRIDVRYEHDTAASRSTAAVTLGLDRTGAASGQIYDRSVALRLLTELRVLRTLRLTGGVEASTSRYDLAVDSRSPDAADVSGLFPSRRDYAAGAHLELSWSPAPWVTIAPGARSDVYRVGSDTALGVDPRITAVFQPARHVRVTQSLGLSQQPPNFVPQVPATQVGSLKGGLQKAILSSSGFSFELPLDLVLGVTGFRSEFLDLIDPIGGERDFRLDRNVLQDRERGSSVGLEISLRRPLTRRLGGFFAYTLSRTTRHNERRDSLAGFDRTHVLQGALSLDLGRHWRGGARALLYSGIPGLLLARDAANDRYLDSLRAPAYFRLDLRLEKRWPLPGHGYLAAVFEVLNATLSREVTARTCTARHCVDTTSGPLTIPSLGLEAYY